jgi:hypothetical protein
MDDNFWYQDYTVLWRQDRLVEFFPVKDMSINEKLNALTRLAIYLGILFGLLYSDTNYLYIPVIAMLIIYIIWSGSPSAQKGGSDPTACPLQSPTTQNPFMNVLMTDYADNPQRKPAADVENPVVKAQMEIGFSEGLYRDVDDIWDKNNSQRQYYTNPSTTIPNDADSFMKWCYNTPYTCKDNNLESCGRYNPINAL